MKETEVMTARQRRALAILFYGSYGNGGCFSCRANHQFLQLHVVEGNSEEAMKWVHQISGNLKDAYARINKNDFTVLSVRDRQKVYAIPE